MALITDLPSSSSVAATDLFVKDTGSATQKITAADLFPAGLRQVDVLYNGGKAESGTITLSSAYNNYSYLLIEYLTNTDKCTEFFPSVLLDSGSVGKFFAGGDWNTSFNCFQYESTCYISKVNSTTLAVNNKYRDVNWALGVTRILGFK